jgi:sialic acid synthase SpsE
MIHQATEAGADYVKIQAIRSNELTFRERFENGIIDESGNPVAIKRPFQPEYERLSKLDLSLDDEFFFVEESKRAGIKSMITIFTWKGIDEIRPMGFDAIKVASYDCASFPFLKELVKNFPLLFVSTGATFDHEIEKAAEILSAVDFYFLHCVTIYPTPLDQLHFNRFNYLRKLSRKVGFSDHTKIADTGLIASKIALALGADCIERHYTVLDRSETKDGPVSIDPLQLKELSDFAKMHNEQMWENINREFPDWKVTLGNETRELSHAELLNRDYYRGRFASKINSRVLYNWENLFN